MTGFQYDGSQYDAAEWDAEVSTPTWAIAGGTLRVTSVTLTPTTLDLEVRVRDAAERATLQRLDDNAGRYDERQRADGTNEAVDSTAGDNTFEVRPPIEMQPPRAARAWVCEGVERDRTSADTQTIEATVSLVARETRERVTGYADPADSAVWTFEFAGGDVVTDRVGVLTQEATTSLRLVLDAWQAELFETVTSATAGAVGVTVPDGEGFTRDTTPNNRQTVTITPPSGASDPAISQGDYVVAEWASTGSGGSDYRVEMEISSRFETK